MDIVGRGHKRKFSARKVHFCVIAKYVDEIKQDQEIALDLVESIMRPTNFVKEQSRRKTMRINQTQDHKNLGLQLLDVLKIDGILPEANTTCEPSKF